MNINCKTIAELNLFYIPLLVLVPFHSGLHSVDLLPGVHGSEALGGGRGTRPVELLCTYDHAHLCQAVLALRHQLQKGGREGGREEGGRRDGGGRERGREEGGREGGREGGSPIITTDFRLDELTVARK